MITRQPRNASASNQVQATVTYVREIKFPLDDTRRRAGRTHAQKAGIQNRVFLDSLVRGSQSQHEVGLRFFPGPLLVNLADGFYCDLAGLLAAFIAAHAIGNNREPAFAPELFLRFRLPVPGEILVVLALAADVAQVSELDSRPDHHDPSQLIDMCQCPVTADGFGRRSASTAVLLSTGLAYSES